MKRLTGLFLCLLLLLSCTGCGGFDASKYVKAVMDNLYLDDSADYIELVDTSADEAHTAYLEGLSTEAHTFYTYLSFDSMEVSEQTEQRVISLYDSIYAHSRYEVQDAAKTQNGYTVMVRIYPIDIFDQSMDELTAFVEDFYGKISDGEYAGQDEQALDAIYQDSVLTILEGHTASIGYLDPVEVTVQVTQDADKVWGMSDEDFQNIDTYIIGY